MVASVVVALAPPVALAQPPLADLGAAEEPAGRGDETAAAPTSELELSDVSLEEVLSDMPEALRRRLGRALEVDSSSGGPGGFGYRLGALDLRAYLHGYVAFDAVLRESVPFTFDMHYFNVFVGARVNDVLQAEIQLEHEHGEAVGLRFAQLDLLIDPALTVRLGLFLTPFGRYNASLYPEYLTLMPRGPLAMTMREIVPVAWAEVGIQLLGQFEVTEHLVCGYSAYGVNGLEQEDDPLTMQVEDGGGLRAMRGNLRDQNHTDIAFGARVWLRHDELFEVGASVYTGAYTEDGEQRITMADVDLELRVGDFLSRVEGALVLQDSAAGVITRTGVFARVAYSIVPAVRPSLGFDYTWVERPGSPEAVTWQVIADIDFLPWVQRTSTTILRIAAAYRFLDADGDGQDDQGDHVVMAQATTGF